MPEKMQQIADSGQYMALSIVTGVVLVAGAVAGLFKAGKGKAPYSAVPEDRLRKMIAEIVDHALKSFSEKIEDVYRRLEEGQKRMDAERERMQALELELAYRRGKEDAEKRMERNG